MNNFNKNKPWKRLNGSYDGELRTVNFRMYKGNPQLHFSLWLNGPKSGINDYLNFNQLKHQSILAVLLDMPVVVAQPNKRELATIVDEIKRRHSESFFRITAKYNVASGFNEILKIEVLKKGEVSNA